MRLQWERNPVTRLAPLVWSTSTSTTRLTLTSLGALVLMDTRMMRSVVSVPRRPRRLRRSILCRPNRKNGLKIVTYMSKLAK